MIWTGLLPTEFFSYVFLQNALLGAFLTSVICGIIGTLVVANRIVFIAGGLAHSSYGGIGIASLFGLPLLFGAAIFTIFCAIILAYILLYSKEKLDSLIGSLWAFGMALGIILVELKPGYTKDFMGYLFGNILSITTDHLIYMSIFLGMLLLFVIGFYRFILVLSYDSDFAKLKQINIHFLSIALMIILALGIVLSLQSVGIILVIALLSIPAFCSELFTKSLASMMVFSSLISFACMLLGIALSYFYDLQTGASIVIILSIFGLCFLTWHYLYQTSH